MFWNWQEVMFDTVSGHHRCLSSQHFTIYNANKTNLCAAHLPHSRSKPEFTQTDWKLSCSLGLMYVWHSAGFCVHITLSGCAPHIVITFCTSPDWKTYIRPLITLIKFGRHRPSFLVSKRDFLFLIIIIIIIIIIIFLSPRLQRQFTSNLLQTSAQWSLAIHLPE